MDSQFPQNITQILEIPRKAYSVCGLEKYLVYSTETQSQLSKMFGSRAPYTTEAPSL